MRNYKKTNDNPSTTDVNGDWNTLKETMSNFDGHDFSDDNSFSFVEQQKDFYNALDPVTATIDATGKVAEAYGKTTEAIGNVITARQERKTAENKLQELGGKRSAQLSACENNPAFKKGLDRKYRRNRITECQAQVNKRMDAEELEQQDIIRKNIAIEQGRVSNEGVKSASIKSESSTKKYVYIIGGVILAIFIGSKIFKKD
jgi:hypothetical protein